MDNACNFCERKLESAGLAAHEMVGFPPLPQQEQMAYNAFLSFFTRRTYTSKAHHPWSSFLCLFPASSISKGALALQ